MASWQDDPVTSTAPAWAADPVVAAAGAPGAPQTPGAFGNNPMAARRPTLPPPPTGYTPSAVPWLDPINSAMNSIVDSIPVAGRPLTSAGNAVDALINNALGFPSETAADRAKINTAETKQFPIPAQLGGIAGTVAPLAALGTTELGGQLLGTTGSLASRMLAGGLSGAMISGADTATRGGDLIDAAKNAGIGLGVGTLAPAVFRGANNAAGAVTGTGASRAESALANAIVRDGLTPAQAAAKVAALGPAGMTLDAGPNTTGLGKTLASMPGQAQNTLRTALAARTQGATGRIGDMLQSTVGPDVVPSQVLASIKTQQDALGPAYTAVWAKASPVNPQSIVAGINGNIAMLRGPAQQALQKVRQMFNVAPSIAGGSPALTRDPETLFQIRQAIDGMISTEPNPKVIGALSNVRQQVDTALAGAAPGLKAVDAQYADLARQAEAVGTGQQVFATGREAPRPQELQAAVDAAPGTIPPRLRQGATAELYRIVGTNANDVQALNRLIGGEGDWNRARLATVFGPDKANQILGVLDSEAQFARNANRVQGGSDTVEKLSGQTELGGAGFHVPANMSIFGATVKGAAALANAGLRLNQGRVNNELAQLLVGPMSPETQQAFADLLASMKRPSLLAPAAAPLAITRQGQ